MRCDVAVTAGMLCLRSIVQRQSHETRVQPECTDIPSCTNNHSRKYVELYTNTVHAQLRSVMECSTVERWAYVQLTHMYF